MENLHYFAEQANAFYAEQAYRQRVMVFETFGDRRLVQFFGLKGLKHPSNFVGAGSDLQLLSQLTPGD